MKLQGRTHCYGDNIDTDLIIAARYLASQSREELAAHCMEDADADFVKRVKPGDIMVGGANFGCGSSREHAPIAIEASGISCVIAESFARIFYRNAINIGFPILECADAKRIHEGDELSVDLENGVIFNRTQNESYASAAFPPFIQKIIAAKGYLNAIREEKAHE